jgi:DNA-nicking Smr family endonuclease
MGRDDPEVIQVPIDGILDLHAFAPEEVASVVDEYIMACSEMGIHEIRLIHGKGRGVLRRGVHALLQKHPLVRSFALDSGASGWGATVVCVEPAESPSDLNGSLLRETTEKSS